MEGVDSRDEEGPEPIGVRGARAGAGRRVPSRSRDADARRRRRGRGGGGASMTAAAVSTLSTLPLRHLRRGKVREVYEVDAERLLIVATDRVSAFDVVMGEPVPHKGAVLTQLTAWWLRRL